MKINSFLQLVAVDLYRKYGGDMSDVAVIFPNNRARLFFSEAFFAEGGGKPLWSPAYLSISELFVSESNMALADSLKLICELYKVYCKETGSKESFDEFYFWGEILLSDFDDVDKNSVDAHKLFINVEDWEALDAHTAHLDDEQLEALRRFFHHFTPENRSELKRRFRSIWDCLGLIYQHFREQLVKQGLAYEGMMYRGVVERLLTEGTSSLKYKKYVFVGFNVLNKVEQMFFELLQRADKALFYWDYDRYYLDRQSHEAAFFLRRNLEKFPNQLLPDCFDNFARIPKKITFVASSTENAQARYLPVWVNSLKEQGTFDVARSAVVLCNETLLLPVLHAIPDEIGEINVTMGFPMIQTPLYSLIVALLELQTQGYIVQSKQYKYGLVVPILKHAFVQMMTPEAAKLNNWLTENNRFSPTLEELHRNEVLKLLFTPIDGCEQLADYLLRVFALIARKYAEKNVNEEQDNLYSESLFRAYTLVNRLKGLIHTEELVLRMTTFNRLLQRMLSKAAVPFNGEPVRGLQIMGVLETRNLDFDNLMLCSVNEQQLPKGGNENSFIPYLLRKAFGMTTIEQKNALFSYYFFRLLQRASHITLLYNTSSDGVNQGEQSRFLLQLLLESPFEIVRKEIHNAVKPMPDTAIRIMKTPEMIETMLRRYSTQNPERSYLSPSALNVYIDCSLKFYLRHYLRLAAKEEVSEEIDNASFGTIFHKTAELLYDSLNERGRNVNAEGIDYYLESPLKIEALIDRAFNTEFFKREPNCKIEYSGIQAVNRKVIYDFIVHLLQIDRQYAPFRMVAMEEKVSGIIPVAVDGVTHEIVLGGKVDRQDWKEGILRIIDYKTGGQLNVSANNLDNLFDSLSEHRPSYLFQVFLYSILKYRSITVSGIIKPMILYIHKVGKGMDKQIIKLGGEEITDISMIEADFLERLNGLLQTLFDVNIPFVQTENRKSCEYCEFKKICGR